MNPILNADLHCHSVVSDGTLTPEALAQRASTNGVELWALTDHDEIGGQHRAAAAAKTHGMRYLTGTEISVTFIGKTVHIVGLGFDPDDLGLQAGDILLSVNGLAMNSVQEGLTAYQQIKAGGQISIEINRNGHRETRSYNVGG